MSQKKKRNTVWKNCKPMTKNCKLLHKHWFFKQEKWCIQKTRLMKKLFQKLLKGFLL